jgi:hypothetical protein
VELKGEEVQITPPLDYADQDKLVLLVFDALQHCVLLYKLSLITDYSYFSGNF